MAVAPKPINVNFEWPAVEDVTRYDILKDGKKVSTRQDTNSTISVVAGTKVKIVPQTPIPPVYNMPTLNAFEVTLQPHNTDDINDPNNHYTACWAKFHSSVTPRKAPNGVDPNGRYQFKGDHTYNLKGHKWMTNIGIGRFDNNHPVAVPVINWEAEVSSVAFSRFTTKGHAGHLTEAELEYERVQDTQDDELHSGGMNVGFPAYIDELNIYHWLLTELLLGNNEDGILRVWDWVTGKILINLVNINTLKPGQNWIDPWEGGYDSDGVSSIAVARHTPGLYCNYSDGIEALLKDNPTNTKVWGTQADGAGAIASSIKLNVEKVQVPYSTLLAA